MRHLLLTALAFALFGAMGSFALAEQQGDAAGDDANAQHFSGDAADLIETARPREKPARVIKAKPLVFEDDDSQPTTTSTTAQRSRVIAAARTARQTVMPATSAAQVQPRPKTAVVRSAPAPEATETATATRQPNPDETERFAYAPPPPDEKLAYHPATRDRDHDHRRPVRTRSAYSSTEIYYPTGAYDHPTVFAPSRRYYHRVYRPYSHHRPYCYPYFRGHTRYHRGHHRHFHSGVSIYIRF